MNVGIDREKIWESLTISNDFIFAKVMRDKEICRETLEILLDKKIGDIEYIDNQKVIDMRYDSKSIRLDVYVEDEKRIYNIEMQVVNKKDLEKRSRYYQGMMDLDAIEKGMTYRELKDSIVIFICKFDPFGGGLSRYTFENICVEDKGIYLRDGSSKIFFNTKAYDRERREEVKLFLEYIESNIARENKFVKRIDSEVRNVKESEEWRAQYMKLLELTRESFEEGLEEGIAKGKAEGRAEGKAEGKAEGIEEELQRGIQKLIESLRGLKIEDSIIERELSTRYNLSEEEIDKYLKAL